MFPVLLAESGIVGKTWTADTSLRAITKPPDTTRKIPPVSVSAVTCIYTETNSDTGKRSTNVGGKALQQCLKQAKETIRSAGNSN